MNHDCKLLEFRAAFVYDYDTNKYSEILKAKGIKNTFEIRRTLPIKKYEVWVNSHKLTTYENEFEATEYANDYNEKDFYDFVNAVKIWKK